MKINSNLEIGFLPPKMDFKNKHDEKISIAEAFKRIAIRGRSWIEDFWLMILNLAGWMPIWTIRKIFFSISGIRIGSGSVIHTGARFFSPGKIRIGKGTIVGYRSFIDGRGGATIGDHTDIASEVMIYTSEHNIHGKYMEATEEPTEIGDFVFIGPRVIILPGVKIGSGAVVAAGAVVTKNVSAGEIHAGVPAKKIGERKNKSLNYRLGRARMFQ